MHSPLTRAHPSPPSVPAHVPPPLCAGFRHCVGYHTRRRSPPAGPLTDRGRGSIPRGGTTAWSHPRRREVPHGLTEGGLLPRAPAGGIATPPRPSRPASHIHNHLSASPARVCLPPVVTPSHSALLARWQVPAPSRGVFQPLMPVAANGAGDVIDEGVDRRRQRGRRHSTPTPPTDTAEPRPPAEAGLPTPFPMSNQPLPPAALRRLRPRSSAATPSTATPFVTAVAAVAATAVSATALVDPRSPPPPSPPPRLCPLPPFSCTRSRYTLHPRRRSVATRSPPPPLSLGLA